MELQLTPTVAKTKPGAPKGSTNNKSSTAFRTILNVLILKGVCPSPKA